MNAFWRAAVVVPIFIFFSAASWADTGARDITTICGDEVRLFGESSGKSVGWEKRYATPRWQIYQTKDSLILVLAIQHNLFWYGPTFMSASNTNSDEPRSSSAILYGKYKPNVGWVWYEKSWLHGILIVSENLKNELALIEKTKPLAILAAIKEPERTVLIRHMCRKLVRKRIFVYPGNGWR